MIKRDEVLKGSSCLNKAEDDEPIFVLRAHDKLAAPIVRLWSEMARAVGVNNAKCDEAMALAMQMYMWPDRKLPD